MYLTSNGAIRSLTTGETVKYFIISILLNTLGNGLTVSTNLGSAVWTASAANISAISGIKLGTVLLLYGMVVIVLNAILLHEIDLHRILGNFVFMVPFSYMIQGSRNFFNIISVPMLPLPIKFTLDVLALLCVGVAVSIYQRVQIALHPNDDLTVILRFKFLHGNPVTAQLVNFAIPLAIILVIWLATGSVVAFNVGTMIALFIQGPTIGWADKHVFKHLIHKPV